MTKSWQYPHQQIESPVVFYIEEPESDKEIEIKCWAYWAGPNAVEIRIIKHTMTIIDKSNPNMIVYSNRRSAYYSPTGEWVDAEWNQMADPWAIWTEEEAIRKGIKPLEPDVHVYAVDRDACLCCGYNGQQLHHDREAGFEFPCPGWLEVKIG